MKSQDLNTKISSPIFNHGTRLIGTFLIILSAIAPFVDKFVFFQLDNNYGFRDTEVYIWSLFQTLTPIFIMFAYAFKPYAISYCFIVYVYTVQLIWVYMPKLDFTAIELQTLAIISVLIFVLVLKKISDFRIFRDKKLEENRKYFKVFGRALSELKKDIYKSA